MNDLCSQYPNDSAGVDWKNYGERVSGVAALDSVERQGDARMSVVSINQVGTKSTEAHRVGLALQ